MVLTMLKNMSSSMGRMTSHILWKIKNVPNHQPVIIYFSHYYQDYLKESHWSLGLSQIIPFLSHIRSSFSIDLGFTAASAGERWWLLPGLQARLAPRSLRCATASPSQGDQARKTCGKTTGSLGNQLQMLDFHGFSVQFFVNRRRSGGSKWKWVQNHGRKTSCGHVLCKKNAIIKLGYAMLYT